MRLGVQTYSFRELTKQGTAEAVNVIIASMKACGVDECELWSPQMELAPPAGRDAPAAAQATAREALRTWRTADWHRPTSRACRKRFADAGMTVYAYNLSFNDSFTDDEIDKGFEAAKALGAEAITASTTLRVAKRLVPFAEKHRLPVAMHNHSNLTDPNEFATPESFTDGAGDVAALPHQPRHRPLHRRRFRRPRLPRGAPRPHHQPAPEGPQEGPGRQRRPGGTGDTPIRQVLTWLKQRKSPVRAYVEYQYPGTRGAVAEVTACVEFAQAGPDDVTRRLGMGLVGPGFVGAHHIDAVRRLGFVDVVAVAASSEASAQAQGRVRSACRRPTPASRRWPPIPAVHVVHVTTPNALHGAVIDAALAHGKHVVCDKPLATTPDRGPAPARCRRAPPASSTR